MIEPKELRIGNWIDSQEDGHYQVEAIQVNSKEGKNQNLGALYRNGSFWTDCEYLEPIPLTEDWLIKLGFDRVNEDEYKIRCSVNDRRTVIDVSIENDICVDIYTMNPNEDVGSWVNTNNKHVHQLQNLYFALTGEELTIKE